MKVSLSGKVDVVAGKKRKKKAASRFAAAKVNSALAHLNLKMQVCSTLQASLSGEDDFVAEKTTKNNNIETEKQMPCVSGTVCPNSAVIGSAINDNKGYLDRLTRTGPNRLHSL